MKDLLTLLPELNKSQLPLLIQWIEDEIIGDDEATYTSPKWTMPLPAEAYVAYAEGWDKRGDNQRQRLHNLLGGK